MGWWKETRAEIFFLKGHKGLAWDFVASTLVPGLGHLGRSEQEA